MKNKIIGYLLSIGILKPGATDLKIVFTNNADHTEKEKEYSLVEIIEQFCTLEFTDRYCTNAQETTKATVDKWPEDQGNKWPPHIQDTPKPNEDVEGNWGIPLRSTQPDDNIKD